MSDFTTGRAQAKGLRSAFDYIKQRATDIHIQPDSLSAHISFRVDGVLQPIVGMSKAVVRLISSIKMRAKMDITEQRLPQGGSFGIVGSCSIKYDGAHVEQQKLYRFEYSQDVQCLIKFYLWQFPYLSKSKYFEIAAPAFVLLEWKVILTFRNN